VSEAQLRLPFQALFNRLREERPSLKHGPLTMPPAEERERIETLACFAGLALAVHALASGVLGGATSIAALCVVVCLVCDLAIVFGRSLPAISHDTFMWLVRGLVLVHAVALSAYDLALPWSRVSQFSLVAIQALAVTVAIPMTWGFAAGIAGVTCLLQPLAAHLAARLAVVPVEPGDLLRSWLGATITFALCLGLYAVLHQLPEQEGRTAGGYVLKRKLGEGGMGEVWEAQHNALALPAAVKFIAIDQEEASAARFQREARATALLTSIHTVRLYDYGVTNDGRLYYAMELLNGFDLQRVVDNGGPLPPARVVSLMMQVCDSLTEAHSAGLIHRDLKPQNLFITHLGRQFDVVKVLDFGLVALRRGVREAAELSSLTGSGRLTGTPGYFPPEMASGNASDRRSDIYQLGCVMFFLLTGELVFVADAPLATLVRQATEEPRRPSEVKGTAIPRDLDNLVLRCLDREPAKRPRSARSLLRKLQTLECAGEWTQEDARKWWAESAVFPEPTQETAARRLRS
jgi:eukaryotic-like serine/threonine-protein kinase